MVCGLLPDMDVVASAAGPWASLVFHRSWTHSLLVLPLAAIPVGWLGKKLMRSDAPLTSWVHLSAWALVTHPLLDVFTTYGTQLLAPLSDQRFSLDAVSIIDPLFTVPLLVGLVLARFRKVPLAVSRATLATALAWGLFYLGVGWSWSGSARAAGHAAMASHGVQVDGLRTAPMMLYGPNRKVVARTPEGIWVGTMSAFADEDVEMEPLPQATGPAVEAVLDTPEGRIWNWFADGYLQLSTVTASDGTVTVRMTNQKYGRYLAPHKSVFVAEAEVSSTGVVGEVRQTRNVDGFDVGAEFAEGWRLALEGSER